MNSIDYHARRAMEEFQAGMAAKRHEASDAHLRLSSMHMAQMDELARQRRTPAQQPRSCY